MEKLKAQNDELMERLAGLRNEFKTTLQSNQSLLGSKVR